MLHWKNYTGKHVVVQALGVVYEGVVFEMTEASLLLKAPMGIREIPLEAVTRLDLKDDGTAPAAGPLSPSPLAGLPRKQP